MMEEEFDYLVTPTGFDIVVRVGGGAEIERVYGCFSSFFIMTDNSEGSPGYEFPKEGILCEMNASTVSLRFQYLILADFPSPKENPELTKGGILLVKLKALPPGNKLTFKLIFLKYFPSL